MEHAIGCHELQSSGKSVRVYKTESYKIYRNIESQIIYERYFNYTF